MWTPSCTWCCGARWRRAPTEIWRASQGNVLFVRELVLGAVERDHLVHQHGVWRLVGPLVTTARLHELVAARLGALGPSATGALEVLAIGEPAGLSTLEAIVGVDRLEELDLAGMLAVRTDGRRQQVTLSHPALRRDPPTRLTPLTRRRLLLEHADRIDAHGARRREDAFGWPPPGWRRRGRPTRGYSSGRPGWPGTAMISLQVERLSRAAMLGAPRPKRGCCSARRCTSRARSRKPRRS